eukprot:143048-Chlamydomonas_euryale.AAC.2
MSGPSNQHATWDKWHVRPPQKWSGSAGNGQVYAPQLLSVCGARMDDPSHSYLGACQAVAFFALGHVCRRAASLGPARPTSTFPQDHFNSHFILKQSISVCCPSSNCKQKASCKSGELKEAVR